MKMFLSLLGSFAMTVAADTPIVLPPVKADSSLPKLMVVFIPGGNVPNSNYIDTATAVQKASSTKVELWFVIPAVAGRLCITQCTSVQSCAGLQKDISQALDAAVAHGWVRNTNKSGIFLAGHSLGGVCANTLMQVDSSVYGGLVTMASYVDETGPFSLLNYPVPVMHLGAELDGLTRPGKLSLWWRQFLELQSKSVDALIDKPVIILPGQNHSDFCPGFEVPTDLIGEVVQETASTNIGGIVAAFLSIQTHRSSPLSDDVNVIKTRLSFTTDLLTPYITAEDLTSKRYPTASRLRDNPAPQGTSDLCATLQHTVANVSALDDKRLTVENGWYDSSKGLEDCHTNFTVALDGSVSVFTCSHTDYFTVGSCAAAKQLCCKFESTEQVAIALKVAPPAQTTCMELNKHVVSLAQSMALPSTLARFQKRGRGWCLLPDQQTPDDVGPLWLLENVAYNNTAECMQVTSPVLLTTVTSTIYPGNFYCKLLAPERVLDWMMTDSLRPFSG